MFMTYFYVFTTTLVSNTETKRQLSGLLRTINSKQMALQIQLLKALFLFGIFAFLVDFAPWVN